MIHKVAYEFLGGEIAIIRTFSSNVKLLYKLVTGKKPTVFGELSMGERFVEYLMSENESGLFFIDDDILWLLPGGYGSPSYEFRQEQHIQEHPTVNYDSFLKANDLKLTDVDLAEAVGNAISR
jgi:hypothetical protein